MDKKERIEELKRELEELEHDEKIKELEEKKEKMLKKHRIIEGDCPSCLVGLRFSEADNNSAITTCPKCNHEFSLNEVKNKVYENELKANTDNKKYVVCANCQKNVLSKKAKLSFLGFRMYDCDHCGYRTKYPLDSTHKLIYSMAVTVMLLSICVFLFIDAGSGFFVGVLSIVGLPLLIQNDSIERKIPDYKIRIFNTEKG